ncbi:MAG: FtsX-like permease family protein [Clostridium sp.]|nr:FtsX-like permease family protein [Clostridium sp.]
MKSMMRRTTRREIIGSFGRYVAIMAIIALGVGLFAGLKVTKPTMVQITDAYVTKHQLYDYRLISAFGLEEEDVDAFAALDGVRAAEGAVFADVIYYAGEDDAARVASVHSLTQNLNTLELRAGRMPQAADECVVDDRAFSEDAIGEALYVAEDNSEDTLELLAYREYTIVGLVTSPAYLNFERGNTSVGNGVVSCFAYIPKEGFCFDYYSELYVKLDSDLEIHSDAYQAEADAHQDAIEAQLIAANDRRYDTVVSDARREIDEAQETLDEESAKAEAELADALEELTAGQQEIDDNRKLLEEQEQELTEAETALTQGIAEIDDGIRQLEEAVAAANDGLNQLRELEQMQAQMQGQSQMPGGQTLTAEELAAMQGQSQMAGGQAFTAEELAAMQAQMQAQMPGGQTLTAEELAAMQMQAQELQAQIAEITQTIETLEANLTALRTQRSTLAEQLVQVQEGFFEIADAYVQLHEAESELADGWTEYEDGLSEYETKTAEGQQEIDDARRELEELEKPSYYLLTRNENIGYVCFENDSSIVEGIANVFPIFFFLVAALVCITTMNRMVEEQRTQIGVLKALGYGKAAIMGKYMIYSGSAAMIGCISGFLIGSYVFPNVIWTVYGLMYSVGGSGYLIDVPLACISVVVSLICSIGTTWLSCRMELGSVAAQLIRPKTPKAGKRIFLEYLPFLWKRMKFLHKVSARNIFRYKKRFFMMVLGVGGCMALLLTGLGIKDSIADVVVEQYDHIQTYDMAVSFRNAPDAAQREELAEDTQGMLRSGIYYMQASVDISFDRTTKSIDLIVPEDAEQIAEVLKLFDEKGETIAYPGVGEAVLSSKCAQKLGVRIGDTVTLRDGDMREFRVKISGICTNYVYNYVYLSAETYHDQTGREPEYKSMWCNTAEGQDVYEAAAKIMNEENTASVMIAEDTKRRFTSMMSSLNYIVVLVIFCAAALAFIVLYNLTNINITERIREIATIKVLGFYPGETASYVFRENLVLTGIGAVVGIPLGIWLHRFVMEKIDIDMVNFKVRILPQSYVFGIVLTFVFAMVVNGVMYIKLQKINMAESLKSIE